jgi:NitT/TauT family transport system ATP-binding protein
VTHNLEEAVMLCDRIAVMSARPALIKEVITVDIPRPRTMKSMREPAFGRCMEKIWELLRHEVDKAMRVNSPS